ncbi:MAG: aminomethyl-transferring glycine dehydrogenase subunit GcvPB, partial [Terriglobales bacterium]
MEPTRASRHIVQNEDLLFEISSPGKQGYQLPELDVPAATLPATRAEIPDFPELSELEVIRHFTRLSTWNYGVDTGIYPLGSCTMKYNARVNEFVTRIEGLGDGHPLQPEALSRGALRIMQLLSAYLLEITGMDAITLQPAAGAQGELTGILLVREALAARGDARKKVLIPD